MNVNEAMCHADAVCRMPPPNPILLRPLDNNIMERMKSNASPTAMMRAAATFTLLLAASVSANAINYGVDVSFPIHHTFLGDNASVSSTGQVFNGEKVMLYADYLHGCMYTYIQLNKTQDCVYNEEERLRLNINQPRAMTNYTDLGFAKVRLSDELWKTLREFWEQVMNAENGTVDNLEEEYWPDANTYTNHWVSPSKTKFIPDLHEPIYQEVEMHLKEWIPSATSFSRSSLYGIRVYTSGSILAPHVDRDPLISSAIINVGQDVDEEWPLEVYDHEGWAHNITMTPGDVVLYESHSVLHGRPFPLRGKYFANIFVHFKPLFDGEGGEGVGGETEVTENMDEL